MRSICSRPSLIGLALVALGGCAPTGGDDDGAGSPDSGVPAPDLETRGAPDLATARDDLAAPPDLVAAPDLEMSPDLVASADLAASPDLIVPPDLVPCPYDCGAHGRCQSTANGWTCACDAGHEFANDTCADVDECARQLAHCPPFSACRNTAGGYTCQCLFGQALVNGTCADATGGLSINGNAATTSSTSVTLFFLPPGNLLVNGGAETSAPGAWAATTCTYMGSAAFWTVRNDGLFGTHSFQSGHCWHEISQTVDLVAAGVSAAQIDGGFLFTVGGFVASAPPRQDQYQMIASYLDGNGNVLGAWDTGVQTQPLANSQQVGPWAAVSPSPPSASVPTGTRKIALTLRGKDTEVWANNYGIIADGLMVVPGAIEMRVSNDQISWTPWTPHAPSGPWTLTAGSGAKTVAVEYRDGTGASLGVYAASITLE